MTRSETYAARAGGLLLVVAVLAVGKWLIGGGSNNATAALVCLAGSVAAFVMAWRWSWDDPAPAIGTPAWSTDRTFPIADYDDLWVTEILPLLEELDDDELEDVLRYEHSRAARPSVLNEISTLLAHPPLRQGWPPR